MTSWYEQVEVVGEVEAGAAYEYDTFGVFRVPGPKGGKGQLYVGQVAGCSCGKDWDDLSGVSDLEPVTPAQAHAKLNSWAGAVTTPNAPAGEVADLHLKISEVR